VPCAAHADDPIPDSDHGAPFAHHYHVDDGVTRTARDTRITGYDNAPVAESDVDIPAPRRALVQFPTNVRSVRLPVQFRAEHAMVRVTINGKGFDFMLDTGAARLTIDSAVAQQLGLRKYGESEPSPRNDTELNGAVGERWIVDTGGGTFLIFDYFARRHPEALRDKGGGGDDRNARFEGIGGFFSTRPYQIAELRVGNIRFTDFVGYRVTSRGSYEESSDGIIGTSFLQFFTLGINDGSGRIYFIPNAVGRKLMGFPANGGE